MSKVTTVIAGKPLTVLQIISELLQYRSLIWAFSIRDLKVKYFQTVLGPLWVLITPVITVGVMTFIFGFMIKVPSDNLPYLLFYLVAIVPWQAFITVLNQTISSLEAHSGLINKIYFPRLVIGASYALNGTVDFLVGYVLILIFALYYSLLTVQFLLVMPLLLFIQMSWAVGIGLFLAPYTARYRDVKHILPLVIQLYYFACPIMYPVSLAPTWASWLFKLNPFAIVITTYRSMLNGMGIEWIEVLYALSVSVIVLALGALVFMRKGQDMVDQL